MTFNFEATAPDSEDPLRARGEATSADGSVDVVEPGVRCRALLVGQPNVGKSVVFGALTGTYVTVSNYPGTTVEVTRGRATFGHRAWEIVDTPGTHNLVPMSEDEAVTRDLLVSESHDAIVQIGDAKSLSRTLLLTLQIAELGVPFCLDLNMLDEARARGMSIDLPSLERELGGVTVNASTATEGEGLDGVRQYLASIDHHLPEGPPRSALACAPRFPDDVEQAIAEVEARLGDGLPVARRAIATMLLGGERGVVGALHERVGEEARRIARERAQSLSRTHGVPMFALLSRLRLSRAQTIARSVVRRDELAGTRAHAGHVGWPAAIALSACASAVAAVVYDGAVTAASRAHAPGTDDPMADYGFFQVVARLLSRGLFSGWNASALGLFGAVAVLGVLLARRHARFRSCSWKLVGCFAAGWMAYWATSTAQWLVSRSHSTVAVYVGAGVGLGVLALAAFAGDGRDAPLSRALGRVATHPVWGLPILAVVLLLAYKIVGAFGAGTAVDFVENRVFGTVVAQVPLDSAQSAEALATNDVADDGAERLVAVADGGSRVRVVAQTKVGGVYVADRTARIDVYSGALHSERSAGAGRIRVSAQDGSALVEGDVRVAHARIWSGHINRVAFGFFAWLGFPLLTAFFVGSYGLLTMGVTYAIAIVLPVVTTFFFVFSVLEDSGYLPRLAVMSNRILRTMGLNGKAVLPMVLGLGCDTMATLTARILETRKERALVTLLLALGIPCSSQLSVIFALMQRTSKVATLVWLGVVIGTLLGVGWIAARVLPGDRSDFLLEMPPIRQPMISNIVAKTMARIEWYLKEAVPLFLVGTALLFVLDAMHLLVFVHRAGEPIVHYALGFARSSAVSDKVSEALLIGFLRRDFGAAGLLDLARAGRLSPADIAVSMVTITLFIPCIANVFMIAKERGWKVAGAMSGFIFPYAVAVGALVRLGFRAFGG